MAKSQTTTGIAHSDDATFRTWITELSGQLDDVGLTVAADTGQINLATATRPGTNTAAGYQIRYLNDSLHGSKPLYLKIELGTGSAASYPAIWITAGSGTNGAGTITGTTYFARTQITPNFTVGAATYFSGACVLPGYFGLVWKRNYVTNNTPHFFVMRTCDESGAITSVGFHFYYMIGGGWSNRTTYTTSSSADQTAYAFYPSVFTATLVSGQPQVYRHFGAQPQVRCVPFMLSFLDGEIGDLSTFTATPVGSTSRTYLALAGGVGPTNFGIAPGGAWANGRMAFQWE